ncbi:MAG: hypothetical protein WC279_14145 [Sulfurimonas sp.]|jgi:hypothetical protein|uniref:hypothetical protein n=1 Tax=Sulfurimonas sp. TaxID=2022749 RepID=UPI003565AB57
MKSEARKKKAKYYRMTPAQEKAWAKRIGDHLHRYYPGHLWAVGVEHGVAKIYNLLLSGRWGFQIALKDIDAEMRVIMRAGGEVLERYRQKRGWVNPESCFLVPKDIRGEKIHD